jgi:hypothetical protein
MHALSLPTWWIHITSVIEWALAMVAIQRWGHLQAEPAWNWLALAMLPALFSAMAACTWHLFDNPAALQGLVVFQAATTLIGNGCLALAALLIARRASCGARGASGMPPSPATTSPIEPPSPTP